MIVKKSSLAWLFGAALMLSFASGCTNTQRQSTAISSSGDITYAAGYAPKLQAQVQAFDAREAEVKKLTDGFAQYPDQVKSAPKATVLQIVEESDQAGRGASYAERARELENVSTFFEEEKDEINKKVGGSVAYAAKSKGCSGDISGSATFALKEVIEKQSTERQRARNGAHMVIERNRIALGKPAASALEKQADEISRAAYVAYIDMPEKKARIDWMLTEAESVKKTAARFIDQEKAFQGQSGRTEPEKKASEERIAMAQKGINDIDNLVTQTRETAKKLDERIKASQKGYAESIAALKQKYK